jgi:hypothetical protein
LVEYAEFFLSLLVGKCCLGDDQIRQEEMGKACGAYGEEKKYTQGFGGGKLKETDCF